MQISIRKILLFLNLIFFFQIGFSQNIKTEKRVENDSVFIDFINRYEIPVEFSLELTNASFKKYVKLESEITIDSKETYKSVIAYSSKNTNFSIKELFSSLSTKGSFGSKNKINIDENFKYYLPYPKGKTYKIIQGFNGRFSHDKESSRYAIDFNLKVGDTVTAARDGKVFFIKEDSKEFGNSRKYSGKANKIMIFHKDGTIASYVHLKYNGVFVNENDEVLAGQKIGVVGMSGFTTTPHLHFVVHKEKGISIPFQFKTDKKIKQGRKYKNEF